MITHAPQHALVADVADDRSRGPLSWFVGRLQYLLCALHGHDAILQYERNRIFLRCTSCGHETPGWEVSSTDVHRVVESRSPLTAHRDFRVARRIA